MAKKQKKIKINYTNKNKKNKKEYLKLVYFALFLIVILFGVSYGFLSSINVGKKTTEMVSGTLVIEYEDKNSITLNNASPLSDAEGMKLTPYTFTIKNTGTLDGKYNISLEEKDGNTLDKRYVKYSIKEADGEWSTPAYLNTGLILTSNKILASGKEVTYELKMWLDENAGNDVQGQKYDAKIVVNTVQTNAELADMESPIIVLNGNTTVEIEQNQEFIDPGISKITDKNDLSIEDVITRYEYFDGTDTTVVDNVDTTKTGIYYIYYEITDKEGNKGTSIRVVNVYKKDSKLPTIALVGDEVITLKYGEKYEEYGVVATDDEDGNITSNVLVFGSVNEQAPGTYIIKYVVSDKSGNVSSITREVIVLPKEGTLKVELKQDNTDITKTKIDISAVTDADSVKYAITTTKEKPLDSEFKTLEELQEEGIVSEDGQIEITKNGTYYIWIKDENGNIKYQEVIVTTIDETLPTCSFEIVEYIGNGLSRDITLTCTDVADIAEKTLTKKSFELSNENAEIVSVSAPIRIENGYKYNLTIKGVKGGNFNVILPKGTLNDKAGNKNAELSSAEIKVSTLSLNKDEITLDINKDNEEQIEATGINIGKILYASENEEVATVTKDGIVKGVNPGTTNIIVTEVNGSVSKSIKVNVEKTLTATFEKNGTGVIGISKYSDICKLTSDNPTSCSVKGPEINVSEGYTAIGWNEDKFEYTGSYDLTLEDNTTFYSISRKEAITLTAKFDANGAILSDTEDRTCILDAVYNDEMQATSCKVTTPTITGSEATPIVVGFSEELKDTTSEDLLASGATLVLDATNNNHTWYAITRNDPITYEVLYEKNGVGVDQIGSTKASCTIPTTYNGVKQDETCNVILPTITTKEGYTPIGWNEDKTAHTGGKVDSEYAIGKDTTLYSISRKDAIVYNAKFVKSGLGVTEIGSTATSCTLEAVYNDEEQATSCEIDLPSITVKEGYTVLGWSEDQATHDDFTKIEDGFTLIKKETTLYSITRKEAIELTFHVNANGSTLSSEEDLSCILEEVYNNEEQATKCEVTFPTITRDTFDILGFSTEEDNQDLDYNYIENNASRQMDIKENGTTYYANTKKDVNVTWDSNGAVLTSTRSSCTIWNNRKTCSVTTPEITREKFEIIGWSTNKDATENDEIIGMNEEIKLTDSITYYAITKKHITITFNKNNAVSQDESTDEEVTRTCVIRNSSTSCNITSPKIVGSENTPIVIGYNEDKDAKVSTYNEESIMSFSSNKEYYAITKSNPITYQATYEKNGVGVSGIGIESDTCTIPSTYNGVKQDDTCDVVLPTITVKEGYTVIGWNEDKLSHDGAKVGDKYAIGKDTTLYAISRKDAIVYTAKFVKSGLGVTAIGSTTDSCTLEAVYNNEEQATTCNIQLPSITVEGLWKVLGWSEDQTTHSDYTPIEDGITLTKKETTLYSITKKDQLILSAGFNGNGATLSTQEGVSCTLEEVYNNEERNDYCILTTPEVSRENFEFIGYNQNPNSHENDEAYDKDANQIKLDVNNTGKAWYAITKRDLTVKYDKNGAEEISKTEDGCTIWNSAVTCSITLPDITRDTFDIIGWNEDKDATVDSEGTIVKQKEIQIDEHKTYYAITKKDIVISYYKNNAIGQTNSLGEIVYDEKVTRECRIVNREETCSIKSPSIVAPYATPIVVGYGISSDSTTSSWDVNITKNVTDSASYYAVTKNNDITYKADFVKQGLGVVGITSNTASCTINATYNGKIQPTTCRITLPTIIVEDGYTALGWSTNQDASTDFISASTLDLDKDITLYAISKKDEVILTGTFYRNGATSQTLFSNGTIVTSTDDKVKVSCSLDESYNDDLQAKSCTITVPIINASNETPNVIGYAYSSDATEKSVDPNTQLTITKDTDYYAITKKDAVTFSADFDGNNSTLSSTSKLSCNIAATYNGVAQAKSCNVDAPTITANKNTPTIVGFNLDSNAKSNDTNYNTSTKKLTLNLDNTGKVWYAITKKNTVTYTVNYKIGDHVTSISKTSGKCVIPETYNGVEQTTVCIIREDDAENNPKITPNVGYTSIGWSQLSSSTVGSPAVVLSKDNMTFYAHASANHYNINYYSDNRLIGTMSVTYDEPFTLQTIEELNLTKRGYTFNSWTSAGVTYKDGVKVSTNLASEEGANVRFDANWDDLEKPICRFVQVGTTTTQNQTIVKMECTDTGSGVVQKTLTPSDFTVSNTTNGIIDSVSAPTAITDGYSYDLTVRGLSVGTFDVTIPANKIVDNWNNGILSATTPTSVVVNGRVYTIKYTKGDNVAAIAATSASCTTEGASIVCNVYLPGITASTGYTPKGWLNVRNVTTGIGESYELTENTTGETLTATSVDITPPKCSISGNPTAWTQSAVLTVSATDDGSGLADSPYSWTSSTSGFSTTTTKTITANGEYKAYAKDKWGNVGECSVTATKIDTTKPSCSFSNFSDTTIVAGNTATIDLTCTDTQSLIDTNTNKLSTTNFAVSAAYAKVTNVTAPTAVTNGYKYTITVQGVSYGAFNISLNANSFKDIADNYNAKVTSSNATAYNKATTGSCNNLTYNGSAQTLASGGTGITFSNNSQINANTYTVTMTPTAQYKYSDEATSKNINCTISQKAVTYTADSASKTYDGTALTKTTATLTSGSLVSGHTATPSITGTITNVGSTTNTLNGITIKSGSTDVTSNYKITKVNGTLEIKIRETTCTASTVSKTYDGQSIRTTHSSDVANGSCTNIVSGQTITYTTTGDITNVTSTTTTNTLSGVTIKSGNSDVTSNYKITKVNGSLTVNKRSTTCTASTVSKVYDGQSIRTTHSTYVANGSCTNIVSGQTITYTTTGDITNVGSTSNTVSSVVIKSGTTDVSGNYTITKATGTLTVTKANATNPTISPYSGTYDGASHSITVSGGSGGTIQYSTDNATWSTTKPTRTNAGTTTVFVRVLGDSNHNSTSSISSTITITRKEIAVPTCASKTYNGASQTLFASGTGYTAAGTTSATDKGTYTATATPTDNYQWNTTSDKTATKNITCTINPYNLSNATIASTSSTAYTGSAIKPTPKVTVPIPSGSTTTLTSGTHFTYSYANNTNAGTATITITGTGNYTGTKTSSFTITRKEIAVPTCSNKTYNGSSQTLFTSGTGYTAGGTTSGTNAATYTATATPTANYQWNTTSDKTAAKNITCKINPYNLSNATIASTGAQTYTGSAIKPTPTVTVPIPSGSTTTLTSGTHFSYSYANNTNVGTATITITGTGNYTGTKSSNFTISQATPSLTRSGSSGSASTGSTTTFTVKSNVAGKYSISSSNTSYATASLSSTAAIAANTNVTATVKAVSVNSSAITITVTFTPTSGNYKSTSTTYSFTPTAITRTATIYANGNTLSTPSGCSASGNNRVCSCKTTGTSTSCSITMPTITAPTNTPTICGYTTSSTGTTSCSTASGAAATLSSNPNYYAQTYADAKTYILTFTKGTGVSAIGSTSTSCTISRTYNGTAQATSCSVNLPTITASSGYTTATCPSGYTCTLRRPGWFNSSGTRIGSAGGTFIVGANGTFTAKARLVVAPEVYYDNSNTGVSCTTAQCMIDEISELGE